MTKTVPLEPKNFWLIYFEDADKSPELFSDESAARHRYKQISVSWNAHLFALVESNFKDDNLAAAPQAPTSVMTKTVPLEPTEEMLSAGDSVIGNTHFDDLRFVARSVYKAMLAAAPEAQRALSEEQIANVIHSAFVKFYMDGLPFKRAVREALTESAK